MLQTATDGFHFYQHFFKKEFTQEIMYSWPEGAPLHAFILLPPTTLIQLLQIERVVIFLINPELCHQSQLYYIMKKISLMAAIKLNNVVEKDCFLYTID